MRGLIGDLRIKTCLVNQNPAETCQVFGKNFSGQLYKHFLEFGSSAFARSLLTQWNNMKKLIPLFLVTFLLLAGCQPVATAAPPPTAQPSSEVCTDRGWSDITNYLYEFDQELNDADPAADISILAAQLNQTKDNISAVEIAGCTENARNLLVSGLNERINGVQLAASGDNNSARIVMRYGFRLIIAASEELINYGIDLKYPKN
jgi:hypothetical protein